MTLKKIAICAALLVLATISVGIVQAGSKGTPNFGASHNAPGQSTSSDPGKSGNSPGDKKNDSTTGDVDNAKGFAPGQKHAKDKR
jgi:hypothetical protein